MQTENNSLLKKCDKLVRTCIKEYALIEDGDKVLIGLSGGKDSLALTQLLAIRSKIHAPKFSVTALHIRNEGMGYASDVETGDSFDTQGAVRVITDDATVYMPMKELVDFTAELKRLQKDMEKAIIDKEFFEKKLNNPGFVAKAPAELIQQQRENLAKVMEKIKMIEGSISEIEKMN